MSKRVTVYLIAMATIWLINTDVVYPRKQTTRTTPRRDKLKLFHSQVVQNYGFPRGSMRDVRSHIRLPEWLRHKKQELRSLRRSTLRMRKRRYDLRDEFLEDDEGNHDGGRLLIFVQL